MAANDAHLGDTLTGLPDLLGADGDAPALLHFADDEPDTWSRRELGERAARLAAGLRGHGIERGERVLLIAGPSPAYLTVALALLRIGAVATPVDAQMDDEDLVRVIADSGGTRVFASRRVARRLARLDADDFDPDELEVFALDGEEDGGDDDPRDWRTLLADEPADAAALDPDDPAVQFYTSGTTGPPKGVPLSHANLVFQLRTVRDTGLLRDDDRLLLPLPLHHVYPFVIGALVPLVVGAGVVMPGALTGGAVRRALREGEVTAVLGVPRLYATLFDGVRERVGSAGRIALALFDGTLWLSRGCKRIGLDIGRLLFRPVRRRIGPNIRILAAGGSPIDPALARNLEALGWPLLVGYGLTETSPLLTLKWSGEGSFESVGRAVEGIELKTDPEALSDPDAAKRKGRGELLARGPGVFDGYHDLPDKTEEDFDGDWFRTGDIARIDDDGFVHLEGRVSTMIVLEGGENLDPEKVEERYAQSEAIDEIGVLERDGELAALVVPGAALQERHEDDEALAEAVREALDERAQDLPSYQRIAELEITREPLARTRLGKLRRKRLDEAWEQAREGEREARGGEPVSEDEMSSEARALLDNPRVRKLWGLLAERYADRRLSPDSRLASDLGVDSLAWVELSLAIEERVGVSVDESWLRRVDTVLALMEAVDEAEEERGSEARRALEEPESVIDADRRHWAERRSSWRKAVFVLAWALIALVLRLYFRLRVVGRDRVPTDGSFVLVPNHASYVDPLAVVAALGLRRARRCFWGAWTGVLFGNPLSRAFSRAAQAVPVEPRRGPFSSLAFGALVLEREQPLVWFAEGARSPDGSLQRFKSGIGLLLRSQPRDVVPVHIDGAHAALPPGRALPRPVRITVRFGEPMDIDELKSKAAEAYPDDEPHVAIARTIEDAVRELGQDVGD